MTAKDTFWDLPRDLKKMSQRQVKEVVAFMAEWPLKKLREHQDIANAQIKIAFDRKDEFALVNLQIRQDILASAIDKKEFWYDGEIGGTEG